MTAPSALKVASSIVKVGFHDFCEGLGDAICFFALFINCFPKCGHYKKNMYLCHK